GEFADGTKYSLRKPVYTIIDKQFGELHKDVMVSPRVGQHIIGMGLLEAIPEKDILANADAEDKNNDGISGRPNYVWNAAENKKSLGRFGWKANQPSVKQQTSGAYLGDIGITTSLNPDQNLTPVQKEAAEAPHGGEPELDDDDLDKTVLYVANLAVPARRNYKDPEVLKGKKIFNDINCSSCHVAQFQTGKHPDFDNLSNQKIFPYTDLLLHDMGPELADNRPDFEASGTEWRTPPLWGIGLIQTVNGHTFFLHDGRARNLEEAILWHGGEAEKSKEQYKKLTKENRERLIKFLRTL
ncbi:MAG: c-type cytochrome, partial [Lentisphaeraceae bacterium]|nr:c-type cytochrome [Lentisphaeraceae bacterium]